MAYWQILWIYSFRGLILSLDTIFLVAAENVQDLVLIALFVLKQHLHDQFFFVRGRLYLFALPLIVLINQLLHQVPPF